MIFFLYYRTENGLCTQTEYMYTFYDLTPRCRLDLSFVFLFIYNQSQKYICVLEKSLFVLLNSHHRLQSSYIKIITKQRIRIALRTAEDRINLHVLISKIAKMHKRI